MPRVQVKSALGAQRIQPQAAPTQRYSRPQVNELQQLAGALAELEPKVGRLAQTVGQFENKEAQLEGGAAALELLQKNKDDIQSAVREGLLRKDQNPFFRLGMEQQFAEVASNRYSQNLLIKMQEWMENDVPAEDWFSLEARERTQWAEENIEGLRGPVFDQLFADSVEPKAYGFGLEFARRAGERDVGRASELAYQQFTNELFSFQGADNREAIQGRITDLQQWLITEMDLDPREVNHTLIRAVTSYALEFRDPRALDLLDPINGVKGGTGTLGTTEYARSAIFKAQQDLEDLLQQDREHDRYDRLYRADLVHRELAQSFFDGSLTNEQAQAAAREIAFDDPKMAETVANLPTTLARSALNQGNPRVHDRLGREIMDGEAGAAEVLDAMGRDGLSLYEGRDLMSLIQTFTNDDGSKKDLLGSPMVTYYRGQFLAASQSEIAAEMNLPSASSQLRMLANDAFAEFQARYSYWLRSPEGLEAANSNDTATMNTVLNRVYNDITSQYFGGGIMQQIQQFSTTLKTPGASRQNRLQTAFTTDDEDSIRANTASPLIMERAWKLGYDLTVPGERRRLITDLNAELSPQEN